MPSDLIQWPLTTDDKIDKHRNVWIIEGSEEAAISMHPGDLLLIYETKWGKPRADGVDYHPGKRAVVATAEISDINTKEGLKRETENYSDGDQWVWKEIARTTNLDSSMICMHDDVCDCLGYSRKYNFRGFGKSGLKVITKKQYECILQHLVPS